jgi:hypothetical protein
MNVRSVYVEGVAFWAPGLPHWSAAAAALRDEALPSAQGSRMPVATLLSAAERRRAPETVSLALEAARMAVAAAGRPAHELVSVFVSANGDLPIIDHLCTTLATDPLRVSPTRFLHSIHNAPAGLWSMVGGGRSANTALTAHEHSFAAGFLEAALQCATDAPAVLLVGSDTAATGLLAHTVTSSGALAVGLVLAAQRTQRASHRIDWSLQTGTGERPAPRSATGRALAHNGMGDALPLFEALARGLAVELALPASRWQSLRLQLEPLATPSPAENARDGADSPLTRDILTP